MNSLGQIVEGLSPEAQLALIICAFAIVCIIIMAIFMMIVDRNKMQTATKGANRIGKLIGKLRKDRSPNLPPEQPIA